MAWAKNGTPSTLTASADTITISNLTANKFNLFLSYILGTSTVDIDTTFNNNSNSVYAQRNSINGSNATAVSGTYIDKSTSSTTIFDILYGCCISGQEKLFIGFLVNQSTAGAANPPSRIEYVAKFVPSPDATVTRIDNNNTGTTNAYDIGSNLTAIGTD